MTVLAEQQAVYKAAHYRLMNGKRPGANLPRQGQTVHRGRPREAVDFEYALDLVIEFTCVPEDLIVGSDYCAAIAARHLLWTILVDGGHSYAAVAALFGVDQSGVRGAVIAYRNFQSAKAVAQ